LVEGGNADIDVKDRWGFTPLDEAMRVRAGPVIDYLEHIKAARAALLTGKGFVHKTGEDVVAVPP
jgi:hypothetical protein